MWYKLSLCFAISFAIQYIMIWLSKGQNIFIDEVSGSPQKFHKRRTPRIGSIGIFLGSCILLLTNKIGLYLLISSLPALIIGLLEDLRNSLSYKLRLPLLVISPILSILLLRNIVSNIGIPLPLLIAIPFTVIAVTGVTNAINIIDGFNGLASGISMIGMGFLGFAAYIVGDIALFEIIVIIGFALAGFFLWNFPKGKIFLGDGGAYLLGFILASLSILLVNRNPGVSPWFPLIVLSYPIWETSFSIYRKKVIRRRSVMKPDRVHLHMLVYKRIAKSHHKTSFYMWMPAILMGSLGVRLYNLTPALIIIFILYIISYNYAYNRIVKFKLKFNHKK